MLYPNDDWRFYLAATRAFGFRTVRKDGSLGDEAAPRFKDALTFAVGKALRSDAFLTLTLPYLQNWRDGRYKRSAGDPVLAGRWSLIQHDIASPWVPQVQAMASHRFAQARAQQDARNAYRLDAFGQGVDETKLGVDVFNGMSDWKGGFAYALLFPDERMLSGQSVYPGFGTRTTLTFGFGQASWGKVVGGLSRETRRERHVDGQVVAESRVVDNGVFATAEVMATSELSVRGTWARRSALFKNRNGSRSDSLTVALLWSVAP